MRQRRVIPVTTLVQYLKGQLDGNAVLHGVLVEGEISNYRRPYSGHMYFSLKDETSTIACVMFAGYNRNLDFQVKNGDKVIVRGDVTIYVAEGRTQILVNAMKLSGTGDLYERFEQLKKKLYAEGLFDEKNKKSLPLYPMDIGILTGKETAANSDVRITLKKRWPVARVTEYYAPMQGALAAGKIIEALKEIDTHHHDILLLVRGGGSLEDLWCFNDEALARCIYALHTPIVTGVGHETDTTLVDYVSDARANTPTGAVSIGTPDIQEVSDLLSTYKNTLYTTVRHTLDLERKNLDHYASSLSPASFHKQIDVRRMHIDFLEEKLQKSVLKVNDARRDLQDITYRFQAVMQSYASKQHLKLSSLEGTLEHTVLRYLEKKQTALDRLQKQWLLSSRKALETKRNSLQKQTCLLDAYSPLKVLSRGYSITSDDAGHTLTSVSDIHVKDTVHVRLANGSLQAVVDKIEKE